MVDRVGHYVPSGEKLRSSDMVGNDERTQLQSGRSSLMRLINCSDQQELSTGYPSKAAVTERRFPTASLHVNDSHKKVHPTNERPAIVSSRPNVIQSSRSEFPSKGIQEKRPIVADLQKQQMASTPLKEAQALLQLSCDVQNSPPKNFQDWVSNSEASSAAHTCQEDLNEFEEDDQYGYWYIVRNGKVLYTCPHCEYTSISNPTFKRHLLVKHKIIDLDIKIRKKKPKPKKKPAKPIKPPKKPEIRYDPGKPAYLTTVRTLQRRDQAAVISKPFEEVIADVPILPETVVVENEVNLPVPTNCQTEPHPPTIDDPTSSYEHNVVVENFDDNNMESAETEGVAADQQAPSNDSSDIDDDEALAQCGYLNYKTVNVKIPSLGKHSDLSIFNHQPSEEDAPLKEAQALLQLSYDGEQSSLSSEIGSAGNSFESLAKMFESEWYKIRDGKICCICLYCGFESTYRTSFKRHLFIKHKTIIEFEVIKIKRPQPPKEKKKYKKKPKKKPPKDPPKKPELKYNPSNPITLTTVRTFQKVNI